MCTGEGHCAATWENPALHEGLCSQYPSTRGHSLCKQFLVCGQVNAVPFLAENQLSTDLQSPPAGGSGIPEFAC